MRLPLDFLSRTPTPCLDVTYNGLPTPSLTVTWCTLIVCSPAGDCFFSASTWTAKVRALVERIDLSLPLLDW